MEKRYQIFVSSTFADLEIGRKKISEAILGLEHFPAGMEIFPASDAIQWDFISRVILECDYYIIVLGGRYGSLSPDGIGYTEMEFDFAVEHQIPIIALVHKDPENIDKGSRETDTALLTKFRAFREKVTATRMVKMWDTQDELGGLAIMSLTHAFKQSPREGWIRASKAASEEQLLEISSLHKENRSLLNQLQVIKEESQETPLVEDLQDTTKEFTVVINFGEHGYVFEDTQEILITWANLWGLIGPVARMSTDRYTLKTKVSERLFTTPNDNGSIVEDHCFDVIEAQFEALGYWALDQNHELDLTELGNRKIREMLVVRK